MSIPVPKAFIRSALSLALLVICTALLAWLEDYFWAGVGAVAAALVAWDMPRRLQPVRDANAILELVRKLGGCVATDVFESELEAIADKYGAYSGEHLESLHEIVQQLTQMGRLSVAAGKVSLAGAQSA